MFLILTLLAQSDVYEPRLTFEPGVAVSYEMWPSGGNGTAGDDAFRDGMSTAAQLALAYAWTPDEWSFELMLKPYVGYSYRKFDGLHFLMGATDVKPDALTITTAHGGLILAAGSMPRGDEWGFLGYLDAQGGWAWHERVRAFAPTLFAGSTELIDASQETYYGGGVGFEVRRAWVAVHIELGVRNFGRARQGSGVFVIDEQDIVLYYLQIGASFSF
jgi:hypothetical protein